MCLNTEHRSTQSDVERNVVANACSSTDQRNSFKLHHRIRSGLPGLPFRLFIRRERMYDNIVVGTLLIQDYVRGLHNVL